MLDCSPLATDIPQPIIEYARKSTPRITGIKKCIHYSSDWKEYNVYAVRSFEAYYGTFTPMPYLIFYDAKTNVVRKPTKEERKETFLYNTPRYFIAYADKKYYFDSTD